MRPAPQLLRVLLALSLLAFVGLGAAHVPHGDGHIEDCAVCKLGGPLAVDMSPAPDLAALVVTAGGPAVPASPLVSGPVDQLTSRGPPTSHR